MNKKLLGITIILLVFCGFVVSKLNNNTMAKVVDYDGSNLLVTIDDKTMDALPSSGNYYLTNYECDNTNTELVWDRTNYKLTVSNGNEGGEVSCSLSFKSNPLLSDMEVGSYVEYNGTGGMVGDNKVTCDGGSCSGMNANQELDKSGYTYGYCQNGNAKYYTTGWRIAYITNNKVKLISAGGVECNERVSSFGNDTYIKMANASALKYCNSSLVDGECMCESTNEGVCDKASTDAWAINDSDFYYITKSISGKGKRLSEYSSDLGDEVEDLDSSLYCEDKHSTKECGYNNDLIDNGGYYWFASGYSSIKETGIYWDASSRGIKSTDENLSYGLRPIINLASTVYITGGNGTIDDPYKISNDKRD